jgi:hypothetical protein
VGQDKQTKTDCLHRQDASIEKCPGDLQQLDFCKPQPTLLRVVTTAAFAEYVSMSKHDADEAD